MSRTPMPENQLLSAESFAKMMNDAPQAYAEERQRQIKAQSDKFIVLFQQSLLKIRRDGDDTAVCMRDIHYNDDHDYDLSKEEYKQVVDNICNFFESTGVCTCTAEVYVYIHSQLDEPATRVATLDINEGLGEMYSDVDGDVFYKVWITVRYTNPLTQSQQTS